MLLLHDAAVRGRIVARIQSLTPNSTRVWGTMTVDQMLWHLNMAFEAALGRAYPEPPPLPPLPKPVIKFVVMRLPWPRGAPTYPDWKPNGERHDFAQERDRLVESIGEFARVPLDSPQWPLSPSFGKLSGKDWSKLAVKHIEHHLRQFSA